MSTGIGASSGRVRSYGGSGGGLIGSERGAELVLARSEAFKGLMGLLMWCSRVSTGIRPVNGQF